MIENPQEVVATMKLTMTIKEWEDLRDQLQTAWPSGRLTSYITELLADARKVFYHEQETN